MKKLIEDIFPYNDAKLTCFERPLYAYINSIGMDPEYLGLATWSFTCNYVKNFSGILSNVPMQWIVDGVDCIYGVQMQITQPINADNAMAIIEQEIKKGYPVMVFIDSFFCPWYPSYYQSHINHYILVVGISDDDKLICLDRPNGEFPYRFLPYQDYFNGRGLGEVILFRYADKDRDIRHHTNQFIQTQIARMKSSNLFNNIRQFSSHIRENFSIKDELGGVHDYRVACIYNWLKGIFTSREKFAVAIQKCDVNIPEDCLENLKNISIQWMNVLVQLMLAKDRNVDFNHIADLILDIADKEETCFCTLAQYFMR